jgi:hypothetical protein
MEAPFLHVTLGNILTILALVGGLFSFAYSIRGSVQVMNTRLSSIEEDLSELRKVVVTMARQEERIAALDQRLLAQGVRVDQIVARLDAMITRELRARE